MTKLLRISALFLTLVVAGCGGGGGGSGGGGGGGSPPPPTTDGTGEITFPWTTSGALSGTVTVSGRASDPDGVARVTVNGGVAQISSVKAPDVASRRALASGVANVSGSSEAAGVEWSADVHLNNGDNTISISIEDSNGDVTRNVAEVSIRHVEVPTVFALDVDRTRVVGLASTLTPTGSFVQNLVEHNYSTDEQISYGNLGPMAASCFREFENEFLFLTLDSNDVFSLNRYDLTNGRRSVVATIPSAMLDAGDDYGRGSPRDIECGGTSLNAYVLVNFLRNGAPQVDYSRIVGIELASGEASILSETDPAETTPWSVQGISLGDGAIVGLHGISPLRPLTSVSLTDGLRTDLAAGLNVGGFDTEPDLASDRVWVATFDGVSEIDLIAGTTDNVSEVSRDDPLAFAEIRAIGFDAANNRVIVGDSDLDLLIAVDVSTGERTPFVSRQIGTGDPLVAPRAFAISSDATRAFVFDYGHDRNVAEQRLYEIDLATGDRRKVGNINQEFDFIADGLALDEAGRRVFVSFPHRILEVNLDTELVEEVANIDTSDLENIGMLLFDAANDRLLATDAARDGIYAISLETGAVEVLSREGELGEGASFGTLVSIARSESATELFAAGQGSGQLFRVNLETGDREPLSTSCNLFGGSGFAGLMQIRRNEGLNELLILGDSLYSLALDSGQCEVLPRAGVLPGAYLFLDVQPASAEQLLATTFRSLLQYDRRTGEVVVVSK